uniref:Uncharacterized protein n=1 Tax=Tanacetum cinerariifolium TaxID=118510 RepID=A0A6L2N1Q7_TANCI|nr:hypothetical protein [Tanacetum cinerariifolium]
MDTVAGTIVPRTVAPASANDDAERYPPTYEAYEQFLAMTNQEAKGLGLGIKRMRTYILRNREEAEQRLLEDYFGNDDTPSKYPKDNFRRRYRMSSTLFAKIVNDITSYDAQPLLGYFHFLDNESMLSVHEVVKHLTMLGTGELRKMLGDWLFNKVNEIYAKLRIDFVALGAI